MNTIIFIADLFFFIFFFFLFISSGYALIADNVFWTKKMNAFWVCMLVFIICIVVMVVYGLDIYHYLRLTW